MEDTNPENLITATRSIVENDNGNSENRLQPKLFFWDNIIFYLASSILGLSVSNIIVDIARPEPNTVACYTPMNTSRDQTEYIKNYCYEHLPFAEKFTLALVIHGTALLVPHYLWKANFSARIDFFFTHAAKLETLRDRNTGEYPHKNFSVVDYMHREFHERKDILIGYIIKLIIQLCIVLLAIFVSVGIFRDFNIEFDCPRKDEHDLFGKVRCSYAKLQFISVLRWIDYALLSASSIVLLYGLYWCIIRSHPQLGYTNISHFCFDFCINSKFYKATRRYRLKNDQHFLLVSLYATNAGLGRVFRSLQIANKIRHELDAQFELLDNFNSMRHSKDDRKADMETNNSKAFSDSKSFPKVMFEICKGIRGKQVEEYKDEVNSFSMTAMDIACGYHSYLFAIARWQLQVVTIVLDPYYSNQVEVFKCAEHGGVKKIRLPTNLFGLPSKHKFDFAEKINYYTGVTPNKPDDKDVATFSLVVIGPLDDKRKLNAVNQIIEMYSRTKLFFKDGCVMLILRPLEVQGKSFPEGTFLEYEPESQDFWRKSDVLCNIVKWPWFAKDGNIDVISKNEFNMGHGDITVQCGDQTCKFALKTYCTGKKLLAATSNTFNVRLAT